LTPETFFNLWVPRTKSSSRTVSLVPSRPTSVVIKWPGQNVVPRFFNEIAGRPQLPEMRRTLLECHKTFGFWKFSNLGVPVVSHVLTGTPSETALLCLQELTATFFPSGHVFSPANDPFISSYALSSTNPWIYQNRQISPLGHRLPAQKPSPPIVRVLTLCFIQPKAPKTCFRWMGRAHILSVAKFDSRWQLVRRTHPDVKTKC
jgi:hypothetical protein